MSARSFFGYPGSLHTRARSRGRRRDREREEADKEEAEAKKAAREEERKKAETERNEQKRQQKMEEERQQKAPARRGRVSWNQRILIDREVTFFFPRVHEMLISPFTSVLLLGLRDAQVEMAKRDDCTVMVAALSPRSRTEIMSSFRDVGWCAVG